MEESLSDLEQDLLKAAYANRDKRVHGAGGSSLADLFDHEALHDVFGFPYRKSGWLNKLPDPRLEPEGEYFSMKDIGQDRFDTVKTSALSAFAQLEARGLCTRAMGPKSAWTGIALTPQGVAAAKKLVFDVPDPLANL